jgi:hypothetical protein
VVVDIEALAVDVDQDPEVFRMAIAVAVENAAHRIPAGAMPSPS